VATHHRYLYTFFQEPFQKLREYFPGATKQLLVPLVKIELFSDQRREGPIFSIPLPRDGRPEPSGTLPFLIP